MADPIPIFTTVNELRESLIPARKSGKTIGFVPTMGALHDGHEVLIQAARQETNLVVTSIFVNPTQFGPKEDYAKYPRNLDADRELCQAAGCSQIFAPSVEEMYPKSSLTIVDVTQLDSILEGATRPGHFRGVCTVVMKLFQIVQPNLAYFGQKDAQQVCVIKQMVRDLNVPIQLRIIPTIREPDGLALSSRNRYLSPEQRAVAPKIYQAMQTIKNQAQAGERNCQPLETELIAQLAEIPGARVDYARIVSDESLQPVSRLDRPALIVVAVYLGTTRLIDNMMIP